MVLLVASGRVVAAASSSFGDGIRVGQSAWSLGMGGAMAASADGVNALALNPAGILATGLSTFHLTHAFLPVGVAQDYFAYAQRLPGGSAFGISLDGLYDGSPSRQLEDLNGNYAGSAGTYPMLFAAATVAGGLDLRPVIPGVDAWHPSAGVAVRVLSQQVDTQRLAGASTDLGLRVRREGFMGGLVVQNVGAAQAGQLLPLQVVPGVAWRADAVLGASDAVLLEADVPLARDRPVYARAGLDYRLVFGGVSAALRVGYSGAQADTGALGLTGGVGFRRVGGAMPWGFDYAFVPYGSLGGLHALAFTLGVAPGTSGDTGVAGATDLEAPPALSVFYPRRGERVLIPVRVRETARVSAKLLDESGQELRALREPGRVAAGRIEIVWNGELAPGVWAAWDHTYRIFIQVGSQTLYYDVIPKTE